MEGGSALFISFPMVLFTLLVVVLGLYWLLVAVRLAPLELFERDSLGYEHTASTLVSLGFGGVPATFALSVLILLAGLVTLAVEFLLLSRLSLGLFRIPVGIAVLWGAFALVSPLAARLCHRVHRWFHGQRRTLLGEVVKVIDEPDADGWAGAVLLNDPGCEVRLHGKPQSDAAANAGEHRVLVKFLPGENAYRSVSQSAYCSTRVHAKRLLLRRKAR